MPYYETAYPSLLGGISQQIPQSRQPGQVTDQVNMVSDLVRGIARRPGSTIAAPLADMSYVPQYLQTRLGGRDIVLEFYKPDSNPLKAFDAITGVPITVSLDLPAYTWITGVSGTVPIAQATMGNSVILVNPGRVPHATTPAPSISQPYRRAGYFYITTGAYNQEYKLVVKDTVTNTEYTATYTTPDGTAAAHVGQSTPEYIVTQLATSIDAVLPADYTVYRDGVYAFILGTSSSNTIEIKSDSNATYIQTSGDSSVIATNVLPARLPAQANGYTVRIGNSAVAAHYRYDSTRRAWLEDAHPEQRKYWQGLGLRLTYNSGVISGTRLDTQPRAAGDAVSNPDLKIGSRITGVSAFQGRLVLFSDQYVCMSAVDDPTIWFRTSVERLIDSDPIEVALTASYPAPYQSGVVFNGNLLVLSDKHQAQIPGDVAITPANATMALVANYGIRSQYAALPLGRSIMLPTNTASGYVGFVEALPPDNFESMLRATEITGHVPTLMKGALSYIAASHTADAVVCGLVGSADEDTYMYVHQFMWSGSDKVHSAWHKWKFKYPVKFAYFIEDTLYIISHYNGRRNLSTINLRRGFVPQHYLDYASLGTVEIRNVGGVPTSTLGPLDVNDIYSGGELGSIRAFKLTGEGAGLGETPDIAPAPVNLRFIVHGELGDTYVVGYPFESILSPTPPIVKDRGGNFIANEHIPLVRFKAQLQNTGEVKVRVYDRVYDSGEFDAPVVPYYALQTLGGVPLSNSGAVNIPCRTEARDTILVMKTSDYYDMNLTNLEYGFKLQLKFRRA